MQSDGYALNNIMSVFAGEDGGIKFTHFLFSFRKFKKEAEEGSLDAQRLLDIVEKFSKLIDACQPSKKKSE